MWRIFALLFLLVASISTFRVHAKSQVPCYFIFGDSLSDAGNNNGLSTKAKANYQPYGIDFSGGRPTGRFTNGRTTADIIAEHLGFEGYIQPHTTANGNEILKGVNYASGSAGIRSETAEHLGGRISLGEQVRNHKRTISKIYGLLKETTRAHLQSCLYTINIGSNDYINNYFMPDHYLTSRRYKPHQFAASLISLYTRELQDLYRSGARKVALFGLGPIGCSLAEIVRHRPKTLCVDSMNVAVQLFNEKLKSLVDDLNHQLPGAKFIIINSLAMQLGPAQGLTVQNATCCNVREDFQCMENTTPCKNRNSYVFWDGYHPTEAVNRIVGGRAYNASNPLEAYPYDISKLVTL